MFNKIQSKTNNEMLVCNFCYQFTIVISTSLDLLHYLTYPLCCISGCYKVDNEFSTEI